MIYGYGDWKRIQKQFKKRELAELRAASRVLVKVYIQNLTEEKTEGEKGLSRSMNKLFKDIEDLLDIDDKIFDKTYSKKTVDSDNDESVQAINWDRIQMELKKPHPQATKNETLQFRSFYHDIQYESLEDKTSPADLIFTKGRNLLMRLQQIHIIKKRTQGRICIGSVSKIKGGPLRGEGCKIGQWIICKKRNKKKRTRRKNDSNIHKVALQVRMYRRKAPTTGRAHI